MMRVCMCKRARLRILCVLSQLEAASEAGEIVLL